MSAPAVGPLRAPSPHEAAAAGPLFGIACFLATLSGVVVLSVLLGSVVAAVLSRPPHHPWYDLTGNLRELFSFLTALVTRPRSTDPARAGFQIGIAGSLWLLALVAVFALPIGIGAAVFLEEYAPPGRVRRIIQTNIANLAGVPSIVYGISSASPLFGVGASASRRCCWVRDAVGGSA